MFSSAASNTSLDEPRKYIEGGNLSKTEGMWKSIIYTRTHTAHTYIWTHNCIVNDTQVSNDRRKA